MTEDAWLGCNDPAPMLDYLNGRAGDRKLRLFACACCRWIWDQLPDERSRRAVEVSERYADGLADEKALGAALVAAVRATRRRTGSGALAAYLAASRRASGSVESACTAAIEATAQVAVARTARAAEQADAYNGAVEAGARRQAAVLRDLFGNPFRPVAVAPAWLRWHGGAVPAMARAIYDDRRFADLPILADALQEAGCEDATLLGHCRKGEEHTRGCWVLDLLLGRG